MSIAERYAEFAAREAHGVSPSYERLASAVAADDGLLALPAPPDGALYNVLALDGEPLAWTRSHGQAMTWFGPTVELSNPPSTRKD